MSSKTSSEKLPAIGITLGDPAGIGPEILAKLLAQEDVSSCCRPVVIGDLRVLQQGFDIARVAPPALAVVRQLPLAPAPETITVYDLGNIAPEDYTLGQVGAAAGRAAGEAIAAATRLALDGQLAAMVTNPIHKESFALGGYGARYPGHTEMISDLCGTKSSCMMLVSGPLRVSHVTTHLPLLEAITRGITSARIGEVIRLTHQACLDLGLEKPRLGVAGLNPHAGEHGLFGDEEQRLILPAVQAAQADGLLVDGPLPADTLFSLALGGRFDAVVALYHDQGHIPVKLAGFRYSEADGRWQLQGINITLGLPIIRTSVDHGTAFDKAGQGLADHHSLLDALQAAARMAGRRRAQLKTK